MDKEDYKSLELLAKSPELFEKKRRHLLDSFISSVTDKKEQTRLRAIQKELDSSRGHSNAQTVLANKMLELVSVKHDLLQKMMSTHLEQQPSSKVIPFPVRR